ncbi:transposase [Hymenobacter sp. BT770]|uniref:transposase n=1 Tax=Hymenobacter sp. BT770 TaxID=2886942 RepID=UPI001D1291C9|nr:transposase [Hymenobacter sp. BT770]MCC3151720.1 transposase [Hymenobacter sp. BT770]MDO3413658.1 transposase [Hymenobacter sp. BT770]
MPLPPGETAFITFRLHGTIPAAEGRRLKAELRAAQEAGTDHRRAQKQFFAQFDAVLDRAPIGPAYFDQEKMAELLAGEIMMLEETGFVVHGFALLPNHLHLVLHLPASSPLSFAKAIDLLHLRTATHCRRLVRPKLPPEAEFWQAGWFDYAVHDQAELTRLLAYVRGNARQAGLPARFQEWPYVFNEE